jgi:hypothetical protein
MMINYVCFYTVLTSNPICYIILCDYNKMDVCDPDAKTKNIRKLIKLHTGHAVNVSRERMCDITREAKKGNLPMPPLVLTRDKRFLLDSKSPLTQKDYETLYKSNTTSADAKRLAKKVGLVNIDKTIADLKNAIGRRLASTGVREPILLPGSRVVSAPKSENFFVNENRNNVQNENRNNENQNRNNENQNRNNENQNRANINSARRNNGDRPNGNAVKPNGNVVKPNGNRPKSIKNTIRNRHKDRIKDFSKNHREPNRREPNRREPNGKKPGFFGRIFGGSKNTSTNKLNTEMKLAQMKRNTQRQVSHQKTVQSRLRLREAKLAKNMISEAEREKRQAINDVTRMQNNKHLLEVELNRRASNSRKKANEAARARRELAKEKLHTGEMNVGLANLRRRLRIRVTSLNNAVRNRDKLKKELNEMKAGGDPAKIKEIQRKISVVDGKIKAQEKIEAAAQTAITSMAKRIRNDAQRNVVSLEKNIETKKLSKFSHEAAELNFPDQRLLNELIKKRDGDPTATNAGMRMGALQRLEKIKGFINDRGLLNNANVGSPEFRIKKDEEIAAATSTKTVLHAERKKLEKELAAVKTAFSNQFSNGNRKNLQNRINAANKKIKNLEEELRKKPNTPTPSPNKPNTPTPSPNKPNTPTPSPNKPNTPTPSPNKPNTPTPSPNKPNTPTPTPSPAPMNNRRLKNLENLMKARSNLHVQVALARLNNTVEESSFKKRINKMNIRQKGNIERDIIAAAAEAQKKRNEQREKNAQNIKNAQEKAKKAETNRNQAQIQAKANLEAAQNAAKAAQSELAKSKNASKLVNKKRELTNLARAQGVLQNLAPNGLTPNGIGPRRPFSTIINGLTVNDLANGGLAGKLPNQIKATGTVKKANQEKREQQKGSVIQSIKNAQNASKAKARLRERLNKMKTIITEKRAKENANRQAREKANKAAANKVVANKAAANKAVANKAAEANKTKTKNLENLFSKYNAIMANNSGWPIRKDLVQEQYRNGKTLERIKDELNVMVNFHRKKAVKGLVSGAIERVKNAEGKALGNARNAYRMKVNGGNKAGLFPTRQEVNILLLQAKTANNMRTIQGYDKMLNTRLNELKLEKNAKNKKPIYNVSNSPPIRGDPRKGANPRGNGVSTNPLTLETIATNPTFAAKNWNQVMKLSLKNHISGENVMARQTIPGFNGKRVENKGLRRYESGWLNRVDKEGDTAVKREKLRKMFDEKFELKKTLLKHEKTNVRTGYGWGQLQSLKGQVMRPFSNKKYDSTKGTDINEAILNAARIKKQIEEATITHAEKILKQQPINMKKAGQKFKTYNKPLGFNKNVPKNMTKLPSATFNMTGGFNGGIRLGAGGNNAINGSNAKPTQGPTVMELGVQAAVAKNKLSNPMTIEERRVAARKAAEATGRLGGRMARQRNNTFRTKGMTAGAIDKAIVNRAKKAEKIAAKRAAKKAKWT